MNDIKKILTPVPYKTLKPITTGEIPNVYMDSLTYAEQILDLIKYIQEVVYPKLKEIVTISNDNIDIMNEDLENFATLLNNTQEDLEEFKTNLENEWNTYKTNMNSNYNEFTDNINNELMNFTTELNNGLKEINDMINYLTNGVVDVKEIGNSPIGIELNKIGIKFGNNLNEPSYLYTKKDNTDILIISLNMIGSENANIYYYCGGTVNTPESMGIYLHTTTGNISDRGSQIPLPTSNLSDYISFDKEQNVLTINQIKIKEYVESLGKSFLEQGDLYYVNDTDNSPIIGESITNATPSKYTYFASVLDNFNKIANLGVNNVVQAMQDIIDMSDYLTNGATVFNVFTGTESSKTHGLLPSKIYFDFSNATSDNESDSIYLFYQNNQSQFAYANVLSRTNNDYELTWSGYDNLNNQYFIGVYLNNGIISPNYNQGYTSNFETYFNEIITLTSNNSGYIDLEKFFNIASTVLPDINSFLNTELDYWSDNKFFGTVTSGATPSRFTYFSNILDRMNEIIETGKIDVTADFDAQFNTLETKVDNHISQAQSIQQNNQTMLDTHTEQITAINNTINNDLDPLIGDVANLEADVLKIQNNGLLVSSSIGKSVVKNIDLPNGWTPINSYITSVKILADDGTGTGNTLACTLERYTWMLLKRHQQAVGADNYNLNQLLIDYQTNVRIWRNTTNNKVQLQLTIGSTLSEYVDDTETFQIIIEKNPNNVLDI